MERNYFQEFIRMRVVKPAYFYPVSILIILLIGITIVVPIVGLVMLAILLIFIYLNYWNVRKTSRMIYNLLLSNNYRNVFFKNFTVLHFGIIIANHDDFGDVTISKFSINRGGESGGTDTYHRVEFETPLKTKQLGVDFSINKVGKKERNSSVFETENPVSEEFDKHFKIWTDTIPYIIKKRRQSEMDGTKINRTIRGSDSEEAKSDPDYLKNLTNSVDIIRAIVKNMTITEESFPNSISVGGDGYTLLIQSRMDEEYEEVEKTVLSIQKFITAFKSTDAWHKNNKE
ncbi:MAG: hypothetical protein ACW99Q_06125 [Candidatus Kariarchaeaceae archaeon]